MIRYPDTNAELHTFRFVEGAGGGSSAGHMHVCGADRYAATFRLTPYGPILLTYVVTGPAKDYHLRATMTRCD